MATTDNRGVEEIGAGMEAETSRIVSIADEEIVVRGGVNPPPLPGTTFCGAHGATLEDAGMGLPQIQLWQTTAGKIREAGGIVEHTPEINPNTGVLNHRHCDIMEGPGGPSFTGPTPNPVPKKDRQY